MRISHPFYGMIEFNGVHAALIDTTELARLKWVSQLGLVLLAFPGAKNSRFTHSLGVAHIAGKIADHLELDKKEKDIVQCAALLHDIGHGPFSHTLEDLRTDGSDHELFAHDTIVGKRAFNLPGAGEVHKILDDFDIPKGMVGKLVVGKFEEKPYLQSIISGPIDADKLDYLMSDSHYTGVNLGKIDVDYAISVMAIKDDTLVFLDKGKPVIHAVRAARSNMMAEVYIHHNPRVGEAMLHKAVELALAAGEIPNFHEYYDGKLITKLEESSNACTRDLVHRLVYNYGEPAQRTGRNMYKIAYQVRTDNGGSAAQHVPRLKKLGKRSIEDILSEAVGVPEGIVLVDFPDTKPVYSETVFAEAGIEFTDKGGKSNYAGFAVYCPAEYRDRVKEAAQAFVERDA